LVISLAVKTVARRAGTIAYDPGASSERSAQVEARFMGVTIVIHEYVNMLDFSSSPAIAGVKKVSHISPASPRSYPSIWPERSVQRIAKLSRYPAFCQGALTNM